MAWGDWMGLSEVSFKRTCSGADSDQVASISELRGRGQTLSKLGRLGSTSSRKLYKPGPNFILSKFLTKKVVAPVSHKIIKFDQGKLVIF